MRISSPHRTRRGKRMALTLLSLVLIWTIIAGGIVGPWLLPPSPSQAAQASQHPESIAIGKKQQSDFSPDGYASYGELIT